MRQSLQDFSLLLSAFKLLLAVKVCDKWLLESCVTPLDLVGVVRCNKK